jgi:hypothetical protein
LEGRVTLDLAESYFARIDTSTEVVVQGAVVAAGDGLGLVAVGVLDPQPASANPSRAIDIRKQRGGCGRASWGAHPTT